MVQNTFLYYRLKLVRLFVPTDLFHLPHLCIAIIAVNRVTTDM